MPINNPPLKSSPSILADWVELRTLADMEGYFRLNNLKRYWDTTRETEESDPSGQQREEDDTDLEGVSGGDEDKFLDALCDELAERSHNLSDSYPFVFNTSGLRFSIKDDLSEGAMVYLFCLLLTHPSTDDILNGSWKPDINNVTRDLFQACSTLAAAGHVSGSAISFGWPRPNDNPPFLVRLKEVYDLFGEGKVVSTPKSGAAPMVKDEEIDVIAWRPQPCKTPGTFYLLGQVASGDNWEDKSLKSGIPYFHRTWFDTPPASDAIPSIFIPHFVQQKGNGSRRDRIDLLTAKFGHIIDRLRLPRYAKDAIDWVDSGTCTFHIERRGDIPKVIDWVNSQKLALQAAGSVPL